MAEPKVKKPSKSDTPFRSALINEFICAMNACLGDEADRLDKKMANNPDLKLVDVFSPCDMKTIEEKAEWYIFDERIRSKSELKDSMNYDPLQQENKVH